jgi:uncharacterized protein
LHLYGVQWRYEYFLVRADCGAAVNKNLPPLIAAMLRPEFYQSKPAEVELRQTHISYVFIAGDRVYKVKKNVKFPFLDYSTLDKRRHFCAEEVRLNRRLAPNTYLGTVGISRLGRAFSLDRGSRDSAHSIEEYAVEMNRLPDSRMLSALLRNDSVDSECLSAIATKLAAFHARVPSDKAAFYGSPQTIAANLRENFRATRPFVDHTITGPSFKTIKAYSEAFQKEHTALIAGRVAQGRVCEGHGDLRAEHICLVDEIEIFDCVEFGAALRYGDIASDIAFLAMDLDFFGCAHLSRQFESAYAAAARDPAMATLLPFYKCYRAYVRGKVESLKSEEQEISSADRQRASLQALRYFCLATRYTESRRKSDPANRLRPDRDGKIDRGRVGFQSDGLSGLQFRSGPKKTRRHGADEPANRQIPTRHLRRAIHRANVREFT